MKNIAKILRVGTLSVAILASICTNLYSVTFGNPFVVMNPDRKMTKEELIKAVRLMVSAEFEAVQNYMQIAETNDDPLVKRVFTDVANEERVHVGEFLRLLSYLEPEENKFYKEGVREVETEMKKLGVKFTPEIIMPEKTPEIKTEEKQDQKLEKKSQEKQEEKESKDESVEKKSIESQIAEQMDQAIELSLKKGEKEGQEKPKQLEKKPEKEIEKEIIDIPEAAEAQIPAEEITSKIIEEKTKKTGTNEPKTLDIKNLITGKLNEVIKN